MIKRFFFRAVIVVVESLVFWGGTSGISNLRQDRSIDSRSKISYVGICREIFFIGKWQRRLNFDNSTRFLVKFFSDVWMRSGGFRSWGYFDPNRRHGILIGKTRSSRIYPIFNIFNDWILRSGSDHFGLVLL